MPFERIGHNKPRKLLLFQGRSLATPCKQKCAVRSRVSTPMIMTKYAPYLVHPEKLAKYGDVATLHALQQEICRNRYRIYF